MRPTARAFVEQLEAHRSAAELAKIRRYFKLGPGAYGEGDEFLGVPMGTVFRLAKASTAMPLEEAEALLESPVHEARAGALRILGYQAARRGAAEAERKALADLCLRRMDRVNSWDLVDLAGLYVVGPYLVDHPRGALARLARSPNLWERRMAIVCTGPLIRAGEVADTFRIARLLLRDEHDLVHKATGWMLRAAGEVDPAALRAFLDRHGAAMPRTLLRGAVAKLPPAERARRLGSGRATVPAARPGAGRARKAR